MALGDLHVFTGEEYVDTELAPLLNENFNSLKEYVDDASRWQVMPVQFKGTNAKFLIHETILGTGTTQVLPLVVLDNTDIAKFSACSLKVVMSTKNGSIAAVNCDISLQKVHNSNECNVNFNTTNSDDAKAEPCTFTYNNIKYAGLKLTTGNADTLWVSGYTTEEWIAPVVNTSVTNLVTLGSDMNVIPTLFKSLQTDKSPVNDYDVVNKKSLNDLTNIKTYSQLSQIGLSGGVLDNSPYAIGNALPANSMLIVGITGEGNTYNYPKTNGQLVVIRSNSNRVYYEVQGNSGSANIENYVGLYIIDQVSTGTVLTWKRILTDVDTGYWQPNETVTRDTVRKLVGKQYAGCFLVCKIAGTTGSTQPSPDPADGAGIIGGGSGSITFYSSLEEIGITPGQESFASIHSALPINSVLEYYYQVGYGLNDNGFYPANYGHVRFTKQWATLLKCEFIRYYVTEQEGDNQDSGNGIGIYYSTTYSSSYPNRSTVWNRHINSQDTASQNLRSTLTQVVIDDSQAGVGIADYAGYSKDGLRRIGGFQVAKQSVNDELRSRNVLYVCDDDNVYHSTIYSDWSPSQNMVLTTMQGLVRIPNHIQFIGKDDGQFGYTEVTSGANVKTIPRGNYFFYGTAAKGDSDTVLAGADFQGISMRQSGQAFQIVCQGSKIFWRYDDNITDATNNPSYSAWYQLATNVNNGWTISKGTNGWVRESSTGFTIQWGSTDTINGTATISFPRTFSTVYQVIPVGNVEETYENWGFPLNERPTTKNFKAAHWYRGQWRYIAVGIS